MPPLPDRFGLFWLVLARTGGVFAVAPLLSTQSVPAPLRAAVSFVVALAAMPAARAPAGGVPQALLPYMAMAVHEVLVGLSIGFLARVVFSAAELAGGVLDVQTGLSIGSTVDPVYGESVTIFGNWFNILAALVFLGVGGLEVLVGSVAVSLRHIPVGSTTIFAAGARTAVDALGWSFVTAMGMAAPTLAAAFITSILLGLLGRAMPQLNLLQTVIPAQIVVALLVVLAAMPLLTAAFGGLVPDTVSWIGRLWM